MADPIVARDDSGSGTNNKLPSLARSQYLINKHILAEDGLIIKTTTEKGTYESLTHSLNTPHGLRAPSSYSRHTGFF